MNRYIFTAWARRIILVLFCVVALMWGIRQASQTYKIWFPPPSQSKKSVQVQPVPDAAKSVGEQFLRQYYTDQSNATDEKMQQPFANLVTPHLQNEWTQNTALLGDQLDLKQVLIWNEKWLSVGKHAALDYQVVLENGRKLHLRLLVVRSGETWLVDRLPSLLPPPVQGTASFESTISLGEQEQKRVEQTVDGFFASWLFGRLDANTRSFAKRPYPLLKTVGENYQLIKVEPVQEKPLVVDATVRIEQGENKGLPFQYRLELVQNENQYEVKKIIGD